ncbi:MULTISPECIES: HNH endonuclease signature motif containing protein [Vibrio harveyi group]|uniref:HNH endonuclease signature motif containing protein n=1 Tax=Vibrio harveyi group TaxID=717610 RepID=UPI00111F86BE|nr:HNH endonuclease [Vibrio alginolyticus]MBT0074750.1 HNH endonuclease [Vibrio alginolyticus]TOG61316.1 endonuclease [Vibrio parahaemolyticus]
MRKVCASAGCKNVTSSRYCPRCQQQAETTRKENAKKRAKRSAQRYEDKYTSFYKSRKWKELREYKLKKDPLCEECKANGFVRAGHDIDHIVEIKDDFSRRLDITNLRTLCRSCHVTKTIRTRKRRTKNYSSNENLWL